MPASSRILALALLIGLACGEPTVEGAPTVEAVSAPEAQPLPSEGPEPELSAVPDLPAAPKPEAEPTRAESIELRFVGDVIFGRYRAAGFDPIVDPLDAEAATGELGIIDGAPFARMREAMAGDVLIANLETPLSETVPKRSPSHADYRFAASRGMARMLVDAGFDVVSLANNHHNDLREAGHEQSEPILRDLGIKAMGAVQAEAPAIRVITHEEKGWRIAFVAVTSKLNMGLKGAPPHVPFVETKELGARLAGADGPIARARENHDLVVVSLHWGEEYTDHPSPRQKKAARALIDAGADVVFGHHPHVLQGVEQYAGGVIAYSMGNFLFENASPIPKQTGVLALRFSGAPGERACLRHGALHPAIMQRRPFHHPAPATGLNYRKLRDRFASLVSPLRTRWRLPAEPGAFVLETLPKCAG